MTVTVMASCLTYSLKNCKAMRIKVEELVINPINPRKIRIEQKRRLQQSVMLFPKMLTVRDIIVNKDNVVLAGNQRTSILKEIVNTTPLDWMVVLQENEKWTNLTETEREKVLEYWKNWAENPEVEVSVAELTEDEEKELIIKDNQEYGEFDYDILLHIYDDVNLINFGMDEGLFYNPDDDDTVTTKIKGSTPKKIDMLTFGKNGCSVTKEEYDILVKAYNDYIDMMGVNYGFVKSLLEKKGVHVMNVTIQQDPDEELPI